MAKINIIFVIRKKLDLKFKKRKFSNFCNFANSYEFRTV